MSVREPKAAIHLLMGSPQSNESSAYLAIVLASEQTGLTIQCKVVEGLFSTSPKEKSRCRGFFNVRRSLEQQKSLLDSHPLGGAAMSFDHKTIDELLRIIEAGLGLTLRSNSRSLEDIERIQAAATKSGATITWVQCIDLNYQPERTPTLSAKAEFPPE